MVDIIVPIYNGMDVLPDCLESIKKYTDLTKHRLILINDCSPDSEIKPYLDSIKVANKNVFILENDENLGFVKTANKGMRLSDNDVLLLNTDTLVTKNWIEKILRCAYSDKQIATVTPFSNNASLVSTETLADGDDLPKHLTVNEYAEIIEKVSFREYPTIPVGVGYCMFIKRSILDIVGMFDEETFGKGYGEEVDFCYRTAQFGYRHALCDDTFIWHKGNTSFTSKEKSKFIEENQEILNQRYPLQTQQAHSFVVNNPISHLHNNIKLGVKLFKNNKKNVLYLLHLDFKDGTSNPYGGTQMHVRDLVFGLRKEQNSVVVSFEKRSLLVTVYTLDDEIEMIFPLNNHFNFPVYHNAVYKKIMKTILLGLEIDLIHIHHVQNHTLDIFDLSEELDIPAIMTIHDYYSVCPRINLFNYKKEYCQFIKNDDMCRTCLKKGSNISADILKEYQAHMNTALNKVKMLYFPDIADIEIFNLNFPDISVPKLAIPHGQDLDARENYRPSFKKEEFNVAFIGGLSIHKGSELVQGIVSQNKNKNIMWHIFGGIGDKKLDEYSNKNLIKHGRYEQDEIIGLLHKYNIHLVCILSIWPETFCYTLSESWQAGIPAVVTNLGALGTRMKTTGGGWIVNYQDTPLEILNTITTTLENKSEYQEKLEIVSKIEIKTIEQMLEDYKQEYSKFDVLQQKSDPVNNLLIYDSFIRANCGKENKEILLERQVQHLEYELQKIYTSTTWRIVNKIWKINFPFKNLFRKVFKKIFN